MGEGIRWRIFLLATSFLVILGAVSAGASPTRHRCTLMLDPETIDGPNPDDVQVAFTVWLDEISRSLEVDVDLATVLLGPRDDLAECFRRKAGDLFVLNGLRFLELRSSLGMRPALVSEKQGGVGESLVFLLPASHGSSSLLGAKGGRLLLCNGGKGRIPRLWVDVLVAEAGADPRQHWSSVKEVSKVSQAVLPLFFGKVDAAVVTASGFETMVELNPQLGRELRVLLRSDKLLDSVTVWRHDYSDEAFVRAFEREVFTIGHLARGKQVLTLYQVRSILPFQEHYVDGLRKLVERARRLSSEGVLGSHP